MTASRPTILATSAGFVPHPRLRFTFGPMMALAVDLASERGVVDGRRARICVVGTASGDDARFQRDMDEAARDSGYELHHLSLFSQPNVDDVESYLRGFDVVWVNGGSVVNLLAVWRAHGLPEIFRTLWQDGVVLAGISAGSLCWFQGGTTDSFGPELAPVTDALGFLPYGNSVHHDSEDGRRPLIHRLVADGTFSEAHCTDDGAGLVYRGTELAEAVTEKEGASAWRVRRDADGTTVEEQIPTRLLA
ncbi:peptidase E [Sanguibacter sp. 4.1]|uniref:Peptidase E n=1 Tax=Sanguibacter biliveldensis TaxID=3030830 RepID=A0AAF1BYA1_9MICO|nr:peptidase E [Sanguibacter sp. 4.1]WPF82621.1 peptidase E [Sanguibacter sp. 4.1]